MSALHFIHARGVCYWGTYAKLVNPNYYGALIRREPMKPGRWYGNKHHAMKYEVIPGQFGENLIVLTVKDSKGEMSTAMTVNGPSYLEGYAGFNYIIVPRWNRSFYPYQPEQSRIEYNCFRNSLQEYPLAPMVPLARRMFKFRDWAA